MPPGITYLPFASITRVLEFPCTQEVFVKLDYWLSGCHEWIRAEWVSYLQSGADRFYHAIRYQNISNLSYVCIYQGASL